ncbi:uncharacterized protein RB166_014241 [Leptodactylus fuscus]|uniref:uncharacterized protein LOC142213186 n=1 Tax=Leptodactylus fuscus TaxID=238119 RepID=UPI003F4EBC44
MNTKQEVRRIRLSEPRTTWEDQGSAEVAAGKLEVMEKFFTPLPHSSGHRTDKGRRKEEASWEGIRDQYYKECLSSSSPSSSSSPWSSESNFGVRGRFSGYQPHAPHSRSCNDLSMARTRGNGEKSDYIVKQKDIAHVRKADRESTERLSSGISKSGSSQKSHSGQARDVAPNSKSQQVDKRILKNGGRRAKSMEALAEKGIRKGQGNDKKKGTEEKQRFSRFLDEITIQVLSPSNLSSLGVKEKHSSHGNREQWKNSSTDSSGSRGKRTQHSNAVEQEVKRKGKAKSVSSTKAKMGAEPPGPRRNRDMSTSPDSVSSSTWRREEIDDASLNASAVSHQPRRASHRTSQEKAMNSGNITEIPKDKKEVMTSGGGVLKGKVQYSEKNQNSECATDAAAKVPMTSQPSWWGGPGGPALSPHSEKNMENFTDTSRRKNDKFSGTHATVQTQDTAHQPSTENLEQDKDSLNQKITELLDHLARAQSTICALEKLNVSSLLRHLPADMLESMKDHRQGPTGGLQTEDPQDFKSTSTVSLQTSSIDNCSGDLKCNREEGKEEGNPTQRRTAFTPWSPRRQRSFSALHTLYTSTESECSLEDTLPTCKLLSPRFPNLGESFSDDRKDDGNSDNCETRAEPKISGPLKPSPPLQSLLPTHRIPQQNHHVRGSSSESSGEDILMNWVEMRSQDPTLDYMSAQKILDTLLGLNPPSDRFVIPKSQTLVDFSSKIEGHVMRSEIQLSNNPKGNPPTSDTKKMSYVASNREDLHNYTERCPPPDNFVCNHYNPLHSPMEDVNRRMPSTEFITPPLPAKRSSFSGNFADSCSVLSPVGEVGFRPLGKNEGSGHHKSVPPSSLSIPDHSTDPPGQCIPFVLRSPSGSESLMGTWEGQHPGQEGGRDRKVRKERVVTFHSMINDGSSKHSQRSKFMSNRFGDQGEGDNSSLDSTLL